MERLVSLLGLFVMVGLAWLMSTYKWRGSLRIVVGGLLLQFALALLVLKTTPGQIFFQRVGDLATELLGYVDDGSRFMFGIPDYVVPVHVSHPEFTWHKRMPQMDIPTAVNRELSTPLQGLSGDVTVSVGKESRAFRLQDPGWEDDVQAWMNATSHEVIAQFEAQGVSYTYFPLKKIAFGVLPTIIFFSALMSILYHLGLMQWIVAAFAWIMQKTLGTSGAETLSAAANIFVGQTEAPLVIRPYVGRMTQSELMSVMVGGFATIAGGVFAIYVSLGVDAGHLLTASVISAPAALLIAKVMVPETETPATLGQVKMRVERTSVNVIEAAATGATDGLKLALNVAAMLIAFLAFIAMVNAIIGWVGSWLYFVGEDQWTLSTALGYLFWPLAWIMGIERADCFHAGQLLGIKMAANEFVAYLGLGELMQPGAKHQLSDRSAMILTYALCGFANFSSIGIQIGGIGGIAPERRADLARLGLRAMIGGTLAAFMTACVAGVLI